MVLPFALGGAVLVDLERRMAKAPTLPAHSVQLTSYGDSVQASVTK